MSMKFLGPVAYPRMNRDWKRLGSLLYDEDAHKAILHLLMFRCGVCLCRVKEGPFLQGDIVAPIQPNKNVPGMVWKGFVGFITTEEKGDSVYYKMHIDALPVREYTLASGAYFDIDLEDAPGYEPHQDSWHKTHTEMKDVEANRSKEEGGQVVELVDSPAIQGMPVRI